MARRNTSPRAARALSIVVGSCAALGCVSVPDRVREDLAPPDGRRPNNYGRFVDTPQGRALRPDVPTIPREAP